MDSPKIKKVTQDELNLIKFNRTPWKNRFRKSTFLQIIPRPGFNIKYLPYKLKRLSSRKR